MGRFDRAHAPRHCEEDLVNRQLPTVACALLMFAVASAVAAADGVRVTSRQTTGGETTSEQIQFDKDHMRVDKMAADGHVTHTMIFDGARQVIWTIEPEAKSYTEITREDLERVSAQMSQMMAQMQQRMKNMPPERRAQMEQMMRGRGMSMAPGKPEYQKTGSDRVGKWACDKYEHAADGVKEDEVCAAGAAALGLAPGDLNVLTELQNFVKGAMPPGMGDRGIGFGNADIQGFPGFPLRKVRFSNGREESRSEVVDVARQPIAAATFELPSGYTKKPFMEGRGR
jgi:hypothetical protein